jgi:hypothetical protein
MRTKPPVSAALLAVLAAAGCGSNSSSKRPSRTPRPVPVKVSNHSYRVRLAGRNEVPAGALKGSAIAVISIEGKRARLCWRFSALKNVTSPLVAHIHNDPAGKSGPIVLPLGGKFSASGCTEATPTLLATIEKTPRLYYVNIHNRKYPGGAVRAQL